MGLPTEALLDITAIKKDTLDDIDRVQAYLPQQNASMCRLLTENVQRLAPVIKDAMDGARRTPAFIARCNRVRCVVKEAAALIDSAGSMGALAAFVKAQSTQEDFVLVSRWLGEAVAGLSPSDNVAQGLSEQAQAIQDLAQQLKTTKYEIDMDELQKRQYDDMRHMLHKMSTGAVSLERGTAVLASILTEHIQALQSKVDLQVFLDEIATGIYHSRQRCNRQEEQFLERIEAAVCDQNKTCTAPDDFMCPISLQLMRKPMIVVETGHTYDATSIEEWFATGKKTCPETGLALESTQLVHNITLQRLIDDWVEKNGDGQEEPMTPRAHSNLKLDNLPSWFSEAALRDLFQPHGTITSCCLHPADGVTGLKSGTVEFATLREAQAAMEAMNGFNLGSTKIEVTAAKRGGREPAIKPEWGEEAESLRMELLRVENERLRKQFGQTRLSDDKYKPPKTSPSLPSTVPYTMASPALHSNLYVNRLPRGFSEGELRKLFEPYGQITAACVMAPEPQWEHNYGFVEFESVEQANAAVAARDGFLVGGNPIGVQFALKGRREPSVRPADMKRWR
ncbi:unnamed protein product [Ostreobium quekettii]|uniref:RING-type E3 ubiquitin transferase n=1 Tax=Ostreobium quekettii TaxID=121088 RepID=A0A8S1J6N8_9CHLO|nr:unnamed protein product [Ostreobium quekettii]|eukprot:evm.model.scf_1482.2 EVM.evm.TU.scf_1482.2   scf_1482:17910-21819(+)